MGKKHTPKPEDSRATELIGFRITKAMAERFTWAQVVTGKSATAFMQDLLEAELQRLKPKIEEYLKASLAKMKS
jgi:hypothetical protein